MKLNLEGKKHIITSGCSFTNGFTMKEKGAWPYYLSNMLGLKLHNQAMGGQGNEYISNSIISYLTMNANLINECIVGIAWSGMSRLMSPIWDGKWNVLDTVQPQDFIKGGKYQTNKDASIFFSDVPFCIYKTYMAILNLNNFLDYHNIPYFYVDAINKTKIDIDMDDKNIIKMAGHKNNSISFNLIDWPYQYLNVLNSTFNDKIFNNFLMLDNYDSILDFMFTDYEKYEKGNPGHPNDIASNEVAEMIYKQIV